jgi:hypothetical protein
LVLSSGAYRRYSGSGNGLETEIPTIGFFTRCHAESVKAGSE